MKNFAGQLFQAARSTATDIGSTPLHLPKSKLLTAFIAVSVGLTLQIGPGNAATSTAAATKHKSGARSTVVQQDTAEVRASLQQLQSMILNEDAKGVASMFTEDGEYIDEDENHSKGHAEIEATFASVFKDVGRPRIALSVDNVVFLSRDVVLIEGTSRLKTDDSVLSKFSVLLVRESKHWKITRVSEHNAVALSAPTVNENLSDLAWLVGDWKAERGGVSVEMTARWVQNHNFIYCKYMVRRPDAEQTVDMQVIAWDPRIAQPVSWAFDSNGSFSSGRWFKQGTDWSVDASGVEKDGSATRATNILSNITGDSFNWMSVNRCMNGLPVNDTAPLMVHRLADTNSSNCTTTTTETKVQITAPANSTATSSSNSSTNDNKEGGK